MPIRPPNIPPRPISHTPMLPHLLTPRQPLSIHHIKRRQHLSIRHIIQIRTRRRTQHIQHPLRIRHLTTPPITNPLINPRKPPNKLSQLIHHNSSTSPTNPTSETTSSYNSATSPADNKFSPPNGSAPINPAHCRANPDAKKSANNPRTSLCGRPDLRAAARAARTNPGDTSRPTPSTTNTTGSSGTT